MQVFKLDDGETAGDIIEQIAEIPQPVYVYFIQDDLGDDYALVSEVEIYEDDLEDVARNTIADAQFDIKDREMDDIVNDR